MKCKAMSEIYVVNSWKGEMYRPSGVDHVGRQRRYPCRIISLESLNT